MLSRIVRLGLTLAAFLTVCAFWCTPAQATKAFADKEGIKNCTYCHVNPGGPRNFRGLYYKAHGLSFADFDNVFEARIAGISDPMALGADARPTNGYPRIKVDLPDVLKFTVKDIDGKAVNLGRYQGDVILIINVASKCGNTPQYKELEKLYTDNKSKDFVILGFPANDFGAQEPGTNEEIKAFCTSTYNVNFPMFSKITVKGDDTAPLYKFLIDKKTDPKFGGEIDWNFAKFLVNRKGEVVARFKAGVKPTDPEFVSTLEKLIKEPKPSNDKTASIK